MKKNYLLIIATLFCFGVNAQTYNWAFNVGGVNSGTGNSNATDASGNTYVTGFFDGTADFDPSVGVANLTALGPSDLFVAKYNSSGAYQWAFRLGSGSANGDNGHDIAIDGSGDVYITGYFAGTADFDPSAGVANLTAGSDNIFVAKYNSAGAYQWALNIGSTGADYGNGIATDGSGGVYVTGYFAGTADFDPSAGVANLTPTGGDDIFVAKYNSAGVYQWAFKIGNAGGFDYGWGIATDASGSVYVTGSFAGTADFDPSVGVANLSAVGPSDIFVAKYNSAGAYQWAFKIGSAGLDYGNGIATDGTGGVCVTGYFAGTADFDPSVATANLTSNGGPDIYVAKYNSTGAYQWAFNIGSAGTDYGNDIATDGSGSVYVTGKFSNNTDFDPSIATANFNATGSNDIFVAKYNSAGAYQWAFNIGGVSNNEGNGIATDGSGNVYVTGRFGGTADFDPSVGVANLTDAASYDIYVAKYASCATPTTPGTISGTTTICSGSTNTYSITAVAGATSYTWALPSGWSGTSTTNSINATASATSGNITVTANNACGNSAAVSLAITVNTIPAAPGTISGTATVCSGTTNTYSVTAVAGATAYTWTLPSGWTGTSTTNSINATASSTSGNITVTANNACGNSSAQILAITVNSVPTVPGAITGNTTICSGSSNTYSISPVAGAVSYTWTFPSGWTGTSTTNSITGTASATGGNVIVTAENACGSSLPQTTAISIITTPATPGTISGTATICSGTTNTYSITAVADASSYTWTLPGGWTGTSTTNSINATASATSGNITVTANNTCGNSSAATLAITVNTIPATPGTITGSTPVCSGTTNTYSITAVAGATSYTWTLPSGWTGTSTTNSINATASATSGNITVTANNACGNSAAASLAITVNTIPATPGTISGTATICSGTTNTYSITAVAGATSYTWTLPGGWTGTSTTNSINATASATSGNVTVTANNACGNSSAATSAITVNSIPTTPGIISGTATICSGTTNTYSITAVAGATSYTWTLPGGWTGTSSTNSINATASTTSGNITVTANNACGNSTAATLAIVVNTIPATPGTISGLASMCIGTGAQTYSITAVGGATSYTWTLPATWSGTSTTNSVVATPGTSGGNITVTANNTCGNSTPQTLAIVINPLPVVTYSQSPSLVCVNATSISLGTVSSTGGTFTGTSVTGSTFNASTAGTGTFIITYTYTDGNGCVNSANSNITVDPCTGISQNTIDNEIMIYPNPTTSVITLSGVEGNVTIEIYNIVGSRINSLSFGEGKGGVEIDLSKETNGIYFIKISSDTGTITKRIIKQ